MKLEGSYSWVYNSTTDHSSEKDIDYYPHRGFFGFNPPPLLKFFNPLWGGYGRFMGPHN